MMVLMDGCNEGWAVFGSWMDGDGVMRTRQAEVYEWFRQGIWWEGIEVARIVRVFYMLVNKKRGAGRDTDRHGSEDSAATQLSD
jgi:hypothetical protein